MIPNKFLPLGTVVLLKDGSHKVMIIGYSVVSPKIDENKMFDYMASLFPEGVFSLDNIMAFNHDDIVKIIHMGHINEEQTSFNKKLIELQKKYVDENNNLLVSANEIVLNEIEE